MMPSMEDFPAPGCSLRQDALYISCIPALRNSPLSEAASRFSHAAPSHNPSQRPGHSVTSCDAYSCMYRESHRFMLVVVAYSCLKDDTSIEHRLGFLALSDCHTFLLAMNNLDPGLHDSVVSNKSTTCCTKDSMGWCIGMQRYLSSAFEDFEKFGALSILLSCSISGFV